MSWRESLPTTLMGNLDKIINGLIQGDAALQLPKASEAKFLLRMQEVNQAWGSLKQTITAFRQDPQKKDDLLARSEDYFALANKAVSDAEECSKHNVNVLRIIETILFCLSAAILAFIWVGSRRKISAPLIELTTKVKQIARGDLTVAIEAKSNDEIGMLSRSMAAMVSGLRDILDRISTSSKAVASAVEELRTISRRMSDGGEKPVLPGRRHRHGVGRDEPDHCGNSEKHGHSPLRNLLPPSMLCVGEKR